MKIKAMSLSALALLTIGAAVVSAQDEGMPPMGPPEEIKSQAWLIGEWKVEGKFLMDTAGTWVDQIATATYFWTAGGAAIGMEYKSSFMGMEFIGNYWQAYDREEGHWQSAWVDNMSGRISLYTGQEKDGTMTFSGQDKYGGVTMYSKLKVTKTSDSTFNWKMEQSPDGVNYQIGGTAKYTKVK